MRQGLIGALLQEWGARSSNRGPGSLPEVGRAASLHGVRAGARAEVGPEGWLRWSALPSGGAACRGHLQDLLLLLALQKWRLGFWSFCILLSIICPKCTCTQLFLVPYGFSVFCCSRRGVSGRQHCSKGSQVPGPSLSQTFSQHMLDT